MIGAMNEIDGILVQVMRMITLIPLQKRHFKDCCLFRLREKQIHMK